MKIKDWHSLLIVLLIAAIPLFAHLDGTPVQVWDESRLAESALEMTQSNNWLIPTFNGEPDMWSTKPPLMICLEAVAIKIFGINELAVRLPAAIAALATCLLLWWFFTRKMKDQLMGICVPAVLVTIAGYVNIHGTRTGDYDSLLTLFSTGFILFYFLYLKESSQKYFRMTIIMIIAAALTKGVQGMIFLPVLMVYTLFKKQMAPLLKKPQTYLGIGLFLFIVIGYYVLREQYNPGYIKAVAANELGGRYNTVTEEHSGNGWSNFNLLVDTYFTSWYQLIIPGIIFGFYSKEKWMRPLLIYISATFLFYFLVISNAKTQIEWYMLPLYPLLAILTAFFICSMFRIISELSITNKKYPSAIAAYIFLICIFITPYSRVYNFAMGNVVNQSITEEERDMSALMYNVLHKNERIDGYTIVNEYFNQSINWYNHVFTLNHIPVHYESKDKL